MLNLFKDAWSLALPNSYSLKGNHREPKDVEEIAWFYSKIKSSVMIEIFGFMETYGDTKLDLVANTIDTNNLEASCLEPIIFMVKDFIKDARILSLPRRNTDKL